MKQQRIKEILNQIKKVNIAVYGDFCFDAYWILDPAGSERSVETGQQGRAVSKHYYSLGGALMSSPIWLPLSQSLYRL